MRAQPLIISIDADTKMSDLIDYDCHLLLVLNRFKISLGFGDKTVGDICSIHQVDMDCFLTITRFLINPEVIDAKAFSRLNPASVLSYLRNSHEYFLNERLPDLRVRLEEILKDADKNYQLSILKFFNDYCNEVYEHMNYENNVVFPYIDRLLAGNKDEKFSIDEFTSNHGNIDEKISDLKHLFIKYMLLSGDPYKITNILFDLFLSEEDLFNHCFIEDKALVPLVRKIERNLNQV